MSDASASWYFVDRNGQRQGPVDADTLRERIAAGDVDGNGLVWRDGMADWAPLASVAGELGVAVPPPAPRIPPPAPLAPPKKKNTGCLVAVVAVVLGVLFFGGILAAISISQYQDYVAKAQVAEGAAIGDGAKTAVVEAYVNTGQWPTDNAEAGLSAPDTLAGKYVAALEVRPGGHVIVTYRAGEGEVATPVRGASLEFVPTEQGGSVGWTCRSDTLEQKYCPRACECSK